MIDKDGGGTLSTDEIVTAVKEDKVANAASYNAANFNLRGLRDLRNCCFRVFGVWWCRNNRTTASHFAPFAGRDPLPEDVRRGELAVFARARAPQEVAGLPRHGRLRRARRRRVARRAASSMVSCRSSDVASTPSTRRRRRVEARLRTRAGRRRSTGASRSGWSRWPTSAPARRAPRPPPTRNFLRSSSTRPGRCS